MSVSLYLCMCVCVCVCMCVCICMCVVYACVHVVNNNSRGSYSHDVFLLTKQNVCMRVCMYVQGIKQP